MGVSRQNGKLNWIIIIQGKSYVSHIGRRSQSRAGKCKWEPSSSSVYTKLTYKFSVDNSFTRIYNSPYNKAHLKNLIFVVVTVGANSNVMKQANFDTTKLLCPTGPSFVRFFCHLTNIKRVKDYIYQDSTRPKWVAPVSVNFKQWRVCA